MGSVHIYKNLQLSVTYEISYKITTTSISIIKFLLLHYNIRLVRYFCSQVLMYSIEAKLLLDVTDDLALGGGDEGISSLGHDLHEVAGEITSGQVKTQDSVGEGVTLVDGDGVGDTITNVEDETGGAARGVEGKDGLDTDVHGGAVERLEGDLGHLFSVGLGVERGLRVEDGRLIGRDSQLVVEGVMPDLLHIIPVGDDTVLDGVDQREDTSLGLSLVADVGIFVAHADHDAGVLGPADDGREDGARSVTGETGLEH